MGRYPSEADDDATLTDRELIIRLRAQLAQARAAAREDATAIEGLTAERDAARAAVAEARAGAERDREMLADQASQLADYAELDEAHAAAHAANDDLRDALCAMQRERDEARTENARTTEALATAIAERNQLRIRMDRLASRLEASAQATAPSRKSQIEAEAAAAIREALAAVPGGSFEAMLADPNEQFDPRSELLASIAEYAAAPPATAGIQPSEPGPAREALAAVAPGGSGQEAGDELGLRLDRLEAEATTWHDLAKDRQKVVEEMIDWWWEPLGHDDRRPHVRAKVADWRARAGLEAGGHG